MTSILPPELSGVCFFGGRRGVGKSWLSSQADDPRYICFIDYEEKGSSLHYQLDFAEYHSVLPDPNLYQNTLNIINNVKDCTVVIFDNVSILEDAMKAEAKKNSALYAKEFGLTQSNIVSGRFGGASAVVNKLISYKISAPLHSRGVKLIIGTAHAKPFWGSGGPIPNKWNILGADRWQDLAVLSLILIDGDNPPVPSAIVKKEQLGSIKFNRETGEFDMRRRLPYRLPKCTFKDIKNYLDNPADLDSPAKGETVSPEEYAAYADELTDEQLEMNKMALEIQQEKIRREEQEMEQLLSAEYDEVKKLVKQEAKDLNGMPPGIAAGKILPKIQEQYPDYTIDDIAKMIGE